MHRFYTVAICVYFGAVAAGALVLIALALTGGR